jgi:adenylate cyclase
MGITANPTTQNLNTPSDSTIQLPDFVQEADNISFSEGCCTSCVGIIDIVNSTRVTAGLSRHQMSKYYCLFINWATAVVRGYGGKVVKNTGDGLLFYFPPNGDKEDSKMIRDCLNCSIAMSRLHPNINMKFLSESLPELNYRVSLDYGEISLARTMDSTVLDIFSTTVNVCAKINNIAAPNTVVVGADMHQISKNLVGYSFQELKKTILVADRPYPVYSVSETKTIRDYLMSRKRSEDSVIIHTSSLNANSEVKRF